jgi:hypothetical protein
MVMSPIRICFMALAPCGENVANGIGAFKTLGAGASHARRRKSTSNTGDVDRGMRKAWWAGH